MPIYSYECSDHGEMDMLRSFAELSTPVDCPVCGASMRRVVTVPNLQVMDPAKRKAYAVNEKSAHEPTLRRRHSCGHDHSDGSSCSSKNPSPAAAANKNGLKKYNGPRPWVIEHPR